VGHEPAEQQLEPIVVGRLEEMGHLVHEDVLEALGSLLRELGVEADVAGIPVSAAPLGLHLLDEYLGDSDAGPGTSGRADTVRTGYQLLRVPEADHAVGDLVASIGCGGPRMVLR
jgi:hypothetical protein